MASELVYFRSGPHSFSFPNVSILANSVSQLHPQKCGFQSFSPWPHEPKFLGSYAKEAA